MFGLQKGTELQDALLQGFEELGFKNLPDSFNTMWESFVIMRRIEHTCIALGIDKNSMRKLQGICFFNIIDTFFNERLANAVKSLESKSVMEATEETTSEIVQKLNLICLLTAQGLALEPEDIGGFFEAYIKEKETFIDVMIELSHTGFREVTRQEKNGGSSNYLQQIKEFVKDKLPEGQHGNPVKEMHDYLYLSSFKNSKTSKPSDDEATVN